MVADALKAKNEGRDRFKANYERAFGHSEPKPGGGRFVVVDGNLVSVSALSALRRRRLRKNDATNIRCVGSSIAPKDVAEATRLFGHMGVSYDPKTGDAYYKDRASKLRVLEARGMHDMNEVRGR